jgi:hypothetical protein
LLATFATGLTAKKVFAISAGGYFTGLTTCTTNASFSGCAAAPSTSQNDVISGRTTSNGFEAIPDSAIAGATNSVKKVSFYNWVVGELSAPQNRDKQGAAFIINSMIGAGIGTNPAKDSSPSAAMLAEFKQRLYSSNITMIAPSGSLDPNNYGNGKISFSGRTTSGVRDDFWVTYNANPRPLIIFQNTTNPAIKYYVLEKPCANPVGGLPGLPNPSATIDPSATVEGGGQGPAASITVPLGTTLKYVNSIKTSNTANTGTDSYDWVLTSTGTKALPAAALVESPSPPTNVQLDPNRTSSSSTYNNFTPAVAGTYCRRITVSGYPGYAVLVGGAYAQACAIVGSPPAASNGVYTVTAVGNTHEKGDTNNKKVTYTLNTDTTSGCTGADTIVWGGTDAVDQTTKINDCSKAITAAGNLISGPSSIDVTVTASSLDAKVGVGEYGSYKGTVTSPTVYTGEPTSITVFEVPFARIFGQDVRVCGASDANRFMWDSRGGQLAQKGSFASLAVLFTSDALVANDFNGLHSSTLTKRDSLRSIWGAQSCTPATIDMPTSALTTAVDLGLDTNKRFYKPTAEISIGGNLTGQVTIDSDTTYDVHITSDIISAIPTSSINATTDPVLLIRARNIYIDKGVTRVDAILVASGDIHTCTSPGTNVPVAVALLHSDCNKPLIINGSLNAGTKVHFERAKGTRYLSNSSLTTPGFGAPAADNTNPAETVNFPTYLNFMPLNTKDLSKQGYDSYSVLPPRL